MQDISLFLQHHSTLSAALIFVLVLLTILEFIRSKNSAKKLSPARATQMINHQNAVILDIRAADAFATGHIVDSISIPLSELDKKYKKLDKSKAHPLIIVCAGGLESNRAATLLTQHGFNTHILASGIRGWKEAGMPLTTKE